ncbi:Hsp20/alpha crystallin family protein [Halorussus salinus]|uniref:Hsp20/alpha crystallin family protein n=1 Tax=Halorussus salinus TaxID=1364935 RepID=UPI0010924232|nr:Hsp20/alpha crystallin family protein [Halorussus salinus]
MERHDPFEEMNRMFEQMRTRMWTEGSLGDLGTPRGGRSRTGEDVRMDLKRHDDEYVFVADLPGFEREEIDLKFADGVLTLAAENETHEETGGERAGDERTDARKPARADEIAVRSKVTRSRRVAEQVTIPEEILEDEITASYRNGVLEVHLPLAEPVEETDDEGRIDIRD